jgi:mono/diheme cytochrome c family protein
VDLGANACRLFGVGFSGIVGVWLVLKEFQVMSIRRVALCVTVLFVALLGGAVALRAELVASAEQVAEQEQQIAAFLTNRCAACHSPKDATSGIDLTKPVVFAAETAEHWRDVLDQVQRGEMPPKEASFIGDDDRQTFLEALSGRLDRLATDVGSRDFRFMRLTNQQIAWSWKDLLKIDCDYSSDLIEDPPGKHGQSYQSSLTFTGGHLEVYLSALQKAVAEAIPDPTDVPTSYRILGNDWEQMHYLSRNDLAHGPRRKHRPYRGPMWLEERFQIPLPPNHFFRIYLHDNRDHGQFRVRVYLRNEPPEDGGQRQSHEMTLFMDKGFKSPMHAVDSFTVKAVPGTQIFDVFGNVRDFPGVDPAPVRDDEDPYGIETHFKYRFITLQNCSPLSSPSDTPINNQDWIIQGDGHYVRADDQWIDEWGEDFAKKNWLKRSHAGAQHHSLGKPAVYKAVMKDTSYLVVERIEFEMPWQWPPASKRQFSADGQLTDDRIVAGVRSLAERAWRHSLTTDEINELDRLITEEFSSAADRTTALRSILATVLADARFLYLTATRSAARQTNFERVSWLAAFLWRSVPDQKLIELADRNELLTVRELQVQAERMLADPRSRRFVQDFTSQWLDFGKLNQTAVNPNYYGWWIPNFKHYMKLESIEFFDVLLREKLSCLNCLSADFVVVNDFMAKYYGLPKPASGHRFSKVSVAEGAGGVLTLSAFLTAHSDGEDAHAVSRGVWLRERLLGDPPRDPPPAVPALIELEVPDAHKLSIQDRLAAHRTGICYDCHKDIDPWGVAMEEFDATGKPRKRILKIIEDPKARLQLPVVSNTTIDRVDIAGMSDLKDFLREKHANDFARSFSKSLMSFAWGRPLDYRDEERLRRVTAHFCNHGHRMDELVKVIVREHCLSDMSVEEKSR